MDQISWNKRDDDDEDDDDDDGGGELTTIMMKLHFVRQEILFWAILYRYMFLVYTVCAKKRHPFGIRVFYPC